ncbi:mannitol dehydrogenase family protein [Actinoplanes couchii]|uniref:Mannitol-1-phosphate 5-dehydrogenase n=1 Tax=Actinoplanes couchii TaxID=403638 RepID=A0ABQ3XP33_9ACTN|nr:mannitol dehydrogenase family protein [Actinoplanes couchii]MDR6318622.1 fructuronate reductase [Actinoplanes couchii]GID60230.1 mannitol-1-phosphate 5-dehydrogenase [Actinoplanes couchii]
MRPLLSRTTEGDRPERIVHLGLGAFHRAHQAWYTDRAADAADWGIVAFTGRSTGLADRLTAQQGVYTLVERAPDGDRFSTVGSIVRAVPGGDVAEFTRMLAHPRTAILTLTVTEAAYQVDPEEIPLLQTAFRVRGESPAATPATVLGRILLGLELRRSNGAPALAIVPCDNLAANGETVRRSLETLAEQVSPELRDWLPTGISVVSTSVDRITPRVTPEETGLVEAATGYRDEAPVVTEPFTDWVLSGDFPAGHPAWSTARFTDDIEPWENRKLWLLNGAHTLLAATGRRRGHTTVARAFTDPAGRAEVEALWDEATRHLPDLEIRAYRTALAARFTNPRIEHRLAQIAEDTLTKLRLRIVPVARRERAAGRPATGCATALAASGLDLAEIDPRLAADDTFHTTVRQMRTP